MPPPILALLPPVEALSDIEKQATQTANQGKNRLIGMEQFQFDKNLFDKLHRKNKMILTIFPPKKQFPRFKKLL